MKYANEYVLGYDRDTKKPVLVFEYNRVAGEAKIKISGVSDGSMILLKNLSFKCGVEGYGNVEWKGENFTVTVAEHQFFSQEFPDMIPLLHSEYMAADRWLTLKKKKYKDYYRFLLNWIRRARGGNANAGGVAL